MVERPGVALVTWSDEGHFGERSRRSRDGPLGEPDRKPEVDEPSFTPFSPVNGERYHTHRDCPALRCAKERWCPVCSKKSIRLFKI